MPDNPVEDPLGSRRFGEGAGLIQSDQCSVTTPVLGGKFRQGQDPASPGRSVADSSNWVRAESIRPAATSMNSRWRTTSDLNQ